jgi:hypothetical protein
MSKSNFEEQEDQKLTAFLKQHKPIAPPPAIDLEQQILAQIERIPIADQTATATSQPLPGKIKKSRHWLTKGLWLLPAAIAIASGIFWANNRQPEFALSEAERLELEAALISSWTGAIDRDLDNVIDPYAIPGNSELNNTNQDGEDYEATGYSYDLYSLELEPMGE